MSTVLNTSHQQEEVTFVKIDGGMYGQICTFVRVTTASETLHFALISIMQESDISLDSYGQAAVGHMVPLQPPSGQLKAVNVSNIVDVCVCVPVNDRLCVVSSAPNKVERE